MRSRIFLLATLAIAACNADTFVGGDAGGSDTGSDVPPVGGDGGEVEDGATVDAVVEAATPRFCETVDAQFCADFDIPGDAGAGFFGPELDGGWTATFENTQTKSSPTALEIHTISTPGSAYFDHFLSNGTVHTRIVVEADVYLNTPGFTPDPIFVFRAGVLPDPVFLYGLAAHTGVWKLARAGLGTPLSPPPPTGQWVHAVLGIDVGTVGNVTLDIGSSHAALPAAATGVDGGVQYPGRLFLGAADQYVSNNGQDFFIDNVTATWQ